jgi:Na+-translocating ferredoxin:NAD+ oxidoreductase subunit G
MKEIVKLGFVLMIICAVAAGALAYTNSVTSIVIAEREAREKVAQMQALFPEVDDTEDIEVDGRSATVGTAGGKLVGLIYEGRTEGYGGTIRFNLAVAADGKIVSLTILSHSETPGLGDKILAESFRNQFTGKTADDPISVGQDIDNIAGATVSARAMASGVKKELQEVMIRFMGAEAPAERVFNPGALKDGKYTGSADGFKSTIKVEVTVQSGKIADIKVLEQDDTQSFYDKAENDVIPRIIEKQSVEVDATSGATGSSNGILQAVFDALAQ